MISITLSILPQSLAQSAFFNSAIIHASVSGKKLIKSSFNAGYDSKIVYFISDIVHHLQKLLKSYPSKR